MRKPPKLNITDFQNGEIVVINLDLVREFRINRDDHRVTFVFDKDHWITSKETFDQVMSKIME